ncbi:hypothetical protein M0813_00868 [Anaeramoeba flamelloides]|uniref:B-block binding subunit of TFIIIC domain-containing protein n=1 Tax=Anaeramoeba flamelloides TaxID=1746091 RepID=A0ABQ8XEQ3_9EUKA|nr:hypothetical protein M0813_00868 [Anaeramoeba flamelloides]
MQFIRSLTKSKFKDFYGLYYSFAHYLYSTFEDNTILDTAQAKTNFVKKLSQLQQIQTEKTQNEDLSQPIKGSSVVRDRNWNQEKNLDFNSDYDYELNLIIQIFIQTGLISNENSEPNKPNVLTLSPSWRPIISHISNSVKFYNEQQQQQQQQQQQLSTSNNQTLQQNSLLTTGNERTRQSRTISMLGQLVLNELRNGSNTREAISKNTGFARQRICTVLSVFKAIGLVEAYGTRRNLKIKLNKKQERFLPQFPIYLKQLLKLKQKKRKLADSIQLLFEKLNKDTIPNEQQTQINQILKLVKLVKLNKNFIKKKNEIEKEKQFLSNNNQQFKKHSTSDMMQRKRKRKKKYKLKTKNMTVILNDIPFIEEKPINNENNNDSIKNKKKKFKIYIGRNKHKQFSENNNNIINTKNNQNTTGNNKEDNDNNRLNDKQIKKDKIKKKNENENENENVNNTNQTTNQNDYYMSPEQEKQFNDCLERMFNKKQNSLNPKNNYKNVDSIQNSKKYKRKLKSPLQEFADLSTLIQNQVYPNSPKIDESNQNKFIRTTPLSYMNFNSNILNYINIQNQSSNENNNKIKQNQDYFTSPPLPLTISPFTSIDSKNSISPYQPSGSGMNMGLNMGMDMRMDLNSTKSPFHLLSSPLLFPMTRLSPHSSFPFNNNKNKTKKNSNINNNTNKHNTLNQNTQNHQIHSLNNNLEESKKQKTTLTPSSTSQNSTTPNTKLNLNQERKRKEEKISKNQLSNPYFQKKEVTDIKQFFGLN